MSSSEHAFVIRRALPVDLDSIARVELASSEYEGRLHPMTFTVDELRALWYRRLKSGDFEILVAVSAEAPYGAGYEYGYDHSFETGLPGYTSEGLPKLATAHALKTFPAFDGEIAPENLVEITRGQREVQRLAEAELELNKSSPDVSFREQDHFATCGDMQVLGFIGVQAPLRSDGFIQAIYVSPPCYRRGIGTALLQAGERVLQKRGCPRVVLYVEPLNHHGQRFYHKAGYHQTNQKYRHLSVWVKEFASC